MRALESRYRGSFLLAGLLSADSFVSTSDVEFGVTFAKSWRTLGANAGVVSRRQFRHRLYGGADSAWTKVDVSSGRGLTVQVFRSGQW